MRHTEILRQSSPVERRRILVRQTYQFSPSLPPEVCFLRKSPPNLSRQIERISWCDYRRQLRGTAFSQSILALCRPAGRHSVVEDTHHFAAELFIFRRGRYEFLTDALIKSDYVKRIR